MSWWSKKPATKSGAQAASKSSPEGGCRIVSCPDKHGRRWVNDGPSPFQWRREGGSSR